MEAETEILTKVKFKWKAVDIIYKHGQMINLYVSNNTAAKYIMLEERTGLKKKLGSVNFINDFQEYLYLIE